MDDYITDCGYPSVLLYPIDCPSCSVCCNAENSCSRQRKSILKPTVISVIILMVLLGLLSLIYALKKRVTRTGSIQNLFKENVIYWQASKMIGKSRITSLLTSATQINFFHLLVSISQKGVINLLSS